MSAFPRIIQWAKDLFYTAAADGQPWSTGTSPSKVEPLQGLVNQGFRPNVTINAEHLNYLLANIEDTQRQTLVRAIFSVPRRGQSHSAMVGYRSFFKGQGFEETSRWWATFESYSANTASKKTPDMDSTIRRNTNAGYNPAYTPSYGGIVNRSIQPSDDYSSIGRWNKGVVYHAHGTQIFTSVNDVGFAAFDSTVKNLTDGYSFGLGKGVKRYDGREIIPIYENALSVGAFGIFGGSSFTIGTYSCSAGGKSAMCTAHAFKRRLVPSAAPQTIFFAAQNQNSVGSKCVVISLTNDALATQTVLYEGAELYGVGFNMFCAPTYDEPNDAWLIATSNAPPNVLTVPNASTDWITRIYHANSSAPQSASIVSTLSNALIFCMESLGGGNVVALAARIVNGGFPTIEVLFSADSGVTWDQTGRSFGVLSVGGHSWDKAIGDDTALKYWWINQTEDFQTVIAGPCFDESGVVTGGEPTCLVLPFAHKL